jgi:hypothetical protein
MAVAIVYFRSSSNTPSRPSGEWNDDDYDVLADGVVVGRSLRPGPLDAAPAGRGACPWVTF